MDLSIELDFRWHSNRKFVLTYCMELQVSGHKKCLGRLICRGAYMHGPCLVCALYVSACPYLRLSCVSHLRQAAQSLYKEEQEFDDTSETGVNMDLDLTSNLAQLCDARTTKSVLSENTDPAICKDWCDGDMLTVTCSLQLLPNSGERSQASKQCENPETKAQLEKEVQKCLKKMQFPIIEAASNPIPHLPKTIACITRRLVKFDDLCSELDEARRLKEAALAKTAKNQNAPGSGEKMHRQHRAPKRSTRTVSTNLLLLTNKLPACMNVDAILSKDHCEDEGDLLWAGCHQRPAF